MPRTQNGSVFDLSYHLVLVTKYRRKALTLEMRLRLGEVFLDLLSARRCSLVEIGGEPNHIHLLFRAHPALGLSSLVGNLESVSSRCLRSEFGPHLARFYRKPVLWHSAYFVASTGGATLETIKAYVENQGATPKGKKDQAA